MPKGHKKVEETETEQPKKSAPPPEKPDVEQEVRLFQITLKGTSDEGKNVVHGTEKVWLTKAQAKAQGFHWASEPFIGKRKSAKQNA